MLIARLRTDRGYDFTEDMRKSKRKRKALSIINDKVSIVKQLKNSSVAILALALWIIKALLRISRRSYASNYCIYIINADSLIRTFHLPEQNFEPMNQRGSDKRGCTVLLCVS